MLPLADGLGQNFRDLGYSFSLYGPPSRQITHRLVNTEVMNWSVIIYFVNEILLHSLLNFKFLLFYGYSNPF